MQILKKFIENLLKIKTPHNNKTNPHEHHIIDKYKKEYTTHTPFSNCLNLKNNYLSILDIGCYGQNLPLQFSSLKNINFYGVDIDTNNINFLSQKYSNNKNYIFYNNRIIAPKNIITFHKIYKHTFTSKYKNIHFDAAAYQKNYEKNINHHPTDIFAGLNEMTIDEFILKNDINNINFLKIDIDSNDGEILYGSDRLLKKDNLFGIKIEVNFSDPESPKNFYEPYLYLSQHNFVLHKIMTNSYVSDKIPEKFFYNFRGQNFNGSDLYGDLIFFKTLDTDHIRTLTKDKLVNFCRILEIHKLNGMAAEILLKSKDIFDTSELQIFLNKLCEKSSLEIFDKILDYKTFISRINDNPKVLLNDIW